MARKNKNEDLRNRDREERRRSSHKEKTSKEGVSIDCGHSLGISPHLLETPTNKVQRAAPAMDHLAQLRRLFKQEFGYKPTGMSEKSLEKILRERSVHIYGDSNTLLQKLV